jgi:predicted signal transduction protein with EAL and GGDEF domain
MRRSLRRSDTLARIGPGDFAVVLDDLADAEAALPVVEKLLAWVARPFDDGLLRVELSASVGVAVGDGDRRFDDLRAEAVERSLQRAQARGRPLRVLRPEVDRRLPPAGSSSSSCAAPRDRPDRAPLPTARPARRRRRHRRRGLVRWRHPERGLLLPAAFLPQLERAHLGGALFEQVLERSLRQAAPGRGRGARGGCRSTCRRPSSTATTSSSS